MHKVIAFVLFILYRYYEKGKGTKGIGYEQSILVLLCTVFLNALAILIIFRATDILPSDKHDPRWLVYLKYGVVYVVLGFLVLRQLFKKQDIINLQFDETTLRKGNIAVLVYIVVSIILVIVAGLSVPG